VAERQALRLHVDDGGGKLRWITADLHDFSDGGVGISLRSSLSVGSQVAITGKIHDGDTRGDTPRRARVAWCLEKADGTFRAGLQFTDDASGEGWSAAQPDSSDEEPENDYYEILQLSPNAHPDTIHRVFRILAQRFHPDNADSGDEEAFKRVLEAYRVLEDPEKRAAYDTRYRRIKKRHWRLFESPSEAQGVEAERRKRTGILGLLYRQRLQDSDHPFVPIHDLEDLLGCPRDHLQVTLWYLKEKGYIGRDERGRYTITVDGVDEVEREVPEPIGRRMIPAAG
jgi:hypothetical protein